MFFSVGNSVVPKYYKLHASLSGGIPVLEGALLLTLALLKEMPYLIWSGGLVEKGSAKN